MSKAQINIHTAVAGKRLKEDLFEIANRNFSMKLNSYLVSVLEAAVSDKGGYSSTIAYPREKGGSHIAIVLGAKFLNGQKIKVLAYHCGQIIY